MRDYLEVSVHSGAKWVTSNFARGRRLAFYGIGVAFSCHGAKIEMCPEIPCAGPLGDLVRKHKTATSFKFDPKKRKWKVLDWRNQG
jgi:hypothetical protein